MLLKIDCCGNVYYREIDIFSRRDRVNGPATFSTLKTYTGLDPTSVKSSGASLDFCYCAAEIIKFWVGVRGKLVIGVLV